MTPPLSVVIATRDRAEQLAECLASIVESLGDDDEVIVADSSSQDPRVRSIALQHGATYVRCERPGASLARNAGWRAARHELVAFVDDDVRVDPGWAPAIAAAADQHPESQFFTGRLRYPEMAEWQVAVFDEDDSFVIDSTTAEPFGHGANMAVRRSALASVGGYDVRLGPGADFRAAEDLDLWDRLLEGGLEGRYEAAASAWHVQWRDRRAVIRLQVGYGLGLGVRAAKLLRSDRSRGRRAIAVLYWRWGLVAVGIDVRRGQRFRACCHLLRMAVGTVGIVRAIGIPVTDGHLSVRAPHTRLRLRP